MIHPTKGLLDVPPNRNGHKPLVFGRARADFDREARCGGRRGGHRASVVAVTDQRPQGKPSAIPVLRRGAPCGPRRLCATSAVCGTRSAVFDEAALLDKLRKIEALHAGATTTGERVAAAFAADRIRQRLADWRRLEHDIEMQYALPDPWTRSLFIALCRRYGLAPFRHARQRRSTVCVLAPEPFQKNTLWPQYVALSEALATHLRAITDHVIRVAVHEDTADAAVVDEPKPLGPG